MKSVIRSIGFKIERLEQRRLLCGAWHDSGVGPLAGAAEASDAAIAPGGMAGGNDAEGHLIAAFARSSGGMRGGQVVWGESTVIDGAMVATWAIVSRRDGTVMAAGATMPQGLVENQPQQGGSGPAGAIASLEFPAVAQASTYFNHLELHTQPNGHPIAPSAVNPNRYRPAHFDFHFYSVPEAQVLQIPPGPPIAQVSPDRLPAGYAQPGPSEPQMGRHSGPTSELTEPGPFSAVMIAGFTPQADHMHFVEPMITRQVLLQQEDFALPMPMPQSFAHDTRYPTTFQAIFQGDAHHFIFTNFIDTAASAPAADRVGPMANHTRVAHAWGLQPSNSLFDSAVRKDASADDVSTNDEGSVAELLSVSN